MSDSETLSGLRETSADMAPDGIPRDPGHLRPRLVLTAETGRRPELSSMADDYARHALSQRAAFEATHPAVLAAAR
ncbi:MAG: hypothetical protein ABW228_01810, partial [Thermoleophilaceae bacterium]